MGTLNKEYYTKLIEENIAELEKFMPEHSLEKKHTIDVLRESIRLHYPYIPKQQEEKKYSEDEVVELLTNYQFRSDKDYNPSEEVPKTFKIEKERAEKWLKAYNTKT